MLQFISGLFKRVFYWKAGRKSPIPVAASLPASAADNTRKANKKSRIKGIDRIRKVLVQLFE